MACTSGCATQDHESYAACLKAKTVGVAYCNSANGHDFTTQKKFDKALDQYRDARRQGIQPSSTRPDAVRRAVEMSNATGTAFQA